MTTIPAKFDEFRTAVDPTRRAFANNELRKLVGTLRAGIVAGDLTGRDMIFGCRKILDLCVNAGRSTVDAEILVFTSIESQSDHVLGGSDAEVTRRHRPRFEAGSAAESLEVDAIHLCFRNQFASGLNELWGVLNAE